MHDHQLDATHCIFLGFAEDHMKIDPTDQENIEIIYEFAVSEKTIFLALILYFSYRANGRTPNEAFSDLMQVVQTHVLGGMRIEERVGMIVHWIRPPHV